MVLQTVTLHFVDAPRRTVHFLAGSYVVDSGSHLLDALRRLSQIGSGIRFFDGPS